VKLETWGGFLVVNFREVLVHEIDNWILTRVLGSS
jgi:hypothetical protein